MAGDDAKAAENRVLRLEEVSASAAPTVKVRGSQMTQLRVATAERASFGITRSAIGQIAFNDDLTTVISTPFTGRVTRLLAKIGDTVERGAPLFEIDSPEVVQTQTDLIAAAQSVGKAKSQLALAQRTLTRLTELLASRATSQREADQARSDVSAAESDHKIAEGTLQAARNKLRVLVGRSEEEIDRVERERAVNPFFVVTSPIAGTIVSRKIGPGQFVRADNGETLISISDLSRMWLKASVPESDIAYMKPGQEVEVTVPALRNRVYNARITVIGAASDSATHRITVRSEIPNADLALRAEMFATIKITTGHTGDHPIVPLEAVLREADTAFVWVEKEPMLFERRKVELGIERGNRVQIQSGLNHGERVVGRGAIFVDNEWRQ